MHAFPILPEVRLQDLQGFFPRDKRTRVLTGFPKMPWKLESLTSFPFCHVQIIHKDAIDLEHDVHYGTAKICNISDLILQSEVWRLIANTDGGSNS